jgi:hypothetical protein
VDAIPLGATGNMLKTKLRTQLADYKLPNLWAKSTELAFREFFLETS